MSNSIDHTGHIDSEVAEVKNPLAVSLAHLGMDVKLFSLSRGYTDLFDVSSKLHTSIIRIIELRKIFRSYDSIVSAAEILELTRNAVYMRIKTLGCTFEDLRDGTRTLDSLLSPNAVMAERLDELKASCVAHDFPIADEWPQIERTRQPVVKKSPIIASGEEEFTL